MIIVFDLDGTLIDASERMYRLFQKIVPDSFFTKKQYWELKRKKINHRIILERYFPQYSFEIFSSRFLDMIEDDEYLQMDLVYHDTTVVLDELSKSNNIILLTARQKKEPLYEELNRFGILGYFDQILVTENHFSKDELIQYVFDVSMIDERENSLLISDMGKDILDGKKHGFKTIAITHGFTEREKLLEYGPEWIVDDLSEILQIVKGDLQ